MTGSLGLVMVTPLPRCCNTHPDWTVLARHLIDSYPEVEPAAIATEVQFARRAVEMAGLVDEGMLIGELIARYRILVAAGQLPDIARLDPETHAGRAA